jgi:hypothetical protein
MYIYIYHAHQANHFPHNMSMMICPFLPIYPHKSFALYIRYFNWRHIPPYMALKNMPEKNGRYLQFSYPLVI